MPPLLETERELLNDFRLRHSDAHVEQVEDLFVLRWDADEQEVRDPTFDGLMARAYLEERRPESHRYPQTIPSPPPVVWMGLPGFEEGGLDDS
ncbi:MAG: hypothetical protein LLG14_11325 [Nocardiaceae bacterium]|nr:hypothetical protein [Nocardiaceae bacterium]